MTLVADPRHAARRLRFEQPRRTARAFLDL